MRRTNQGGSVLSFIIIGVILAALVLGGAFLARQKIDTAIKPAPAPTSPAAPQQGNGSAQAPAAQPQPSTPSPSSQATVPQPAPSSGKLPQTGPKEDILSLLGVGILGYGLAAYLRSRRALTSSL